MTTIETLRSVLSKNPNATIQVVLPDGRFVPSHFHVTEVGLVRKDFIDCGGTIRSSSACVIQLWVANDVNHRVNAAKLNQIFEMASPVINSKELPVEVEYEYEIVSQYRINAVDMTPFGIVLRLDGKHTACLAPQLCVVGGDDSCCGTSNCC